MDKGHTHTYIFFKFVSASLVSRFHMCLFPYSLSLGAVIEHGYFALTLHKLQHLPPDGQSFSFCVCVCVFMCGPLLASYARCNVLNCISSNHNIICDIQRCFTVDSIPIWFLIPDNVYFSNTVAKKKKIRL